jgi:hypothetical protein
MQTILTIITYTLALVGLVAIGAGIICFNALKRNDQLRNSPDSILSLKIEDDEK